MVKTAWNKGIKLKDNPELLEAHKKGVVKRKKDGSYKKNSGTFEKGQTRAHYPKGRKNNKLSEVRKELFKKGELCVAGERNPMCGVVPNENQLKGLAKGQGRKQEKCNFWKGGITPINKIKRTNKEYKTWRKNVFERDDYTCKECGAKGGYLQAHHIKLFSKFPDKIYELNNGQTLCLKCHRKKHPELNLNART